MRKSAETDKTRVLRVQGVPEYEVVNQAFTTRKGVLECAKFWEEESARMRAKVKDENFPYFTAKAIINLVMVDGRVVASKRVFKRSRMIVDAQDEHLRVCLQSILTILAHGSRTKFGQRWRLLKKAAVAIHEEMSACSREPEMTQVGVIQAPDVIRHELLRAASRIQAKRSISAWLSLKMRRLFDWAQNKKKARGSTLAEVSPVNTPPAGSTPLVRQRQSSAKSELKMKKVPRIRAGDWKTRVQKSASVPFKAFEVKQSLIAGAGKGLFLKENAKEGEEIGRYSGKPLTAEEAKNSSSKYIVRLAADIFLDAASEDELEGRYGNCARKAQIPVNGRIAAVRDFYICPDSGRCWVPIIAAADITAPEEIVYDYGKMYW